MLEVHDRDGERQRGKASIPLNTNKQGMGGTQVLKWFRGRAQQTAELNARALGRESNALWRWICVDLWHVGMSVEPHRRMPRERETIDLDRYASSYSAKALSRRGVIAQDRRASGVYLDHVGSTRQGRRAAERQGLNTPVPLWYSGWVGGQSRGATVGTASSTPLLTPHDDDGGSRRSRN